MDSVLDQIVGSDCWICLPCCATDQIFFLPKILTSIWVPTQGYAEITIQPSDLSNGLIGFAENSKSIEADEDLNPTVTLTLTRLNAYYGDVRVFWKAKLSETSTEAEDVQLASQLEAISGVTTCLPHISVCTLEVQLIDDSVRWFCHVVRPLLGDLRH